MVKMKKMLMGFGIVNGDGDQDEDWHENWNKDKLELARDYNKL